MFNSWSNLNQIKYGLNYFITANLIVFSHGCLVSWITPILPLLKSNDTPLTSGPLSLEEVSWVVSIGALGSMIAALPIRSFTNRVGCKRLMTTYLAILSIVSTVARKCEHRTIFAINVCICHFRFVGRYSLLAGQNMKFWSRDYCVVALVLEMIRPYYYSQRKSRIIGKWNHFFFTYSQEILRNDSF